MCKPIHSPVARLMRHATSDCGGIDSGLHSTPATCAISLPSSFSATAETFCAAPRRPARRAQSNCWRPCISRGCSRASSRSPRKHCRAPASGLLTAEAVFEVSKPAPLQPEAPDVAAASPRAPRQSPRQPRQCRRGCFAGSSRSRRSAATVRRAGLRHEGTGRTGARQGGRRQALAARRCQGE